MLEMDSTTLVIINGSRMLFNGRKTISYEQVLDLLGIKDSSGFSVIYTKGKNNTKGLLMKGKSVEVVDFMRFNVDRTNNA